MKDETEGTPVAASDTLQSSFCRGLRSKKFFLRDQLLATEAAHYLDASNHCWCFHTQQVIGPDGGLVHPEDCTAARGCYESAL